MTSGLIRGVKEWLYSIYDLLRSISALRPEQCPMGSLR
jgi:hypothetical protein